MEEVKTLLVDLFIIYAVARLAAEVFTRLGQPPVIGELLAGILIGPHLLGLVGNPNHAMIEAFHGEAAAREALALVQHTFAEIGAIVLLFYVGLETRVDDLLRVGPRAAAVGTLGILAPLLLGAGLLKALGQPDIEALFVGTAMVATSVGITARVLRDLGALQRIESRIILGAAVIDDILGMLLLAVVAGLAGSGIVSAGEIGLIAAQAIGFVAFVMVAGSGLVRRYHFHLGALKLPHAPFAVAMTAMLGLAALAGTMGLAAIIGAFLAGMVFAEAREQHDLVRDVLPVYELLTPFFFVVTGMQVDVRALLDPTVAGLAAAVTALAVIGKLLGCGVAALGMPRRSIMLIGVGMVPRGEVGLIVASVGRGLGVIPAPIFSVVVVMSLATTLIVPPVLRWLLVRETRRAAPRPHYAPPAVPDEA